jgi:C-8 sterol isomerase
LPPGECRRSFALAMGYVFDPELLHGAAKEAIALGVPLPDKVAFLRKRLDEIYPGHVLQQNEWVLNAAGGALGQMTLLHASVTEYLMIFGSPLGTSGFSGRFLADDYFMPLEGEHWVFVEGETERRVIRPGDMNHLPRGEAHVYRMPERCYALEYARGFIPAMLPFGFADTLTSLLDARTIGRTMRIYGRAVTGELLRGKI